MIITADQEPEPTKLYIAGPMTGWADHNYPAFHRVAATVRTLGFIALSPAELDFTPPHDKPWSFYMKKAITLLLQCDAVVMLDNWTQSKGAKLEWKIAQELGLQIYYESQLKEGIKA